MNPPPPGPIAAIRCAGCSKDLEDYIPFPCRHCIYRPNEENNFFGPLAILYCNTECADNHAVEHKAKCDRRKDRNTLCKIVIILRVHFLAFRTLTFDLNLAKINYHEGVVKLHYHEGPDLTDPTEIPIHNLAHVALSNEADSPVKLKLVALTMGKCDMAYATMVPLAQTLLRCKIELSTFLPSLKPLTKLC